MYKLQADGKIYIVSKHTLEYLHPDNSINLYVKNKIPNHKFICKDTHMDVYYIDIKAYYLECIIDMLRGENITKNINIMSYTDLSNFKNILNELNIPLYSITNNNPSYKFGFDYGFDSKSKSNSNSNSNPTRYEYITKEKIKLWYDVIVCKISQYLPYIKKPVLDVELEDFAFENEYQMEPGSEPELKQEPEQELELKPIQELELKPIQELEPEPEPKPDSKPKHEPKQELIQELIQELTQEPYQKN